VFNGEKASGCDISFITTGKDAFLEGGEDFFEAPRAFFSSAVDLDLAVFDFSEFCEVRFTMSTCEFFRCDFERGGLEMNPVE
jgi:hypothetical protein